MSERPVLFWFRDDLRVADNPGLAAAHATGKPLVTVYILDEESREARALGGASKWWLDKSLRAMSERIAAKGGRLILRKGAAEDVIPALIEETGAEAVFWNRRYGPARKIEERIKAALKKAEIEAHSFNGSLLMDPFALKTGSGGDSRCSRRSGKRCRRASLWRPLLRSPSEIQKISAHYYRVLGENQQLINNKGELVFVDISDIQPLKGSVFIITLNNGTIKLLHD